MRKHVLLLVAGLPGTGKSFLAEKLAKEIDAGILRTDEVRKKLADVKESEHRYEEFGRGLYTEEMTQKTYTVMYEEATEVLRNRSCILDATFSRRSQRSEACKIARRLNLPHLVVECVCPEKVVKARMKERINDRTAVSDATYRIYQRMKDVYEPLREDEPHITVDTSKNMAENLQLILKEIKKIRGNNRPPVRETLHSFSSGNSDAAVGI